MSWIDSWGSVWPTVRLQPLSLVYSKYSFSISQCPPEPLNSRSSAREKLTRLTKSQFQELTVDVYDELIRRNNKMIGNESELLGSPSRDAHV